MVKKIFCSWLMSCSKRSASILDFSVVIKDRPSTQKMKAAIWGIAIKGDLELLLWKIRVCLCNEEDSDDESFQYAEAGGNDQILSTSRYDDVFKPLNYCSSFDSQYRKKRFDFGTDNAESEEWSVPFVLLNYWHCSILQAERF